MAGSRALLFGTAHLGMLVAVLLHRIAVGATQTAAAGLAQGSALLAAAWVQQQTASVRRAACPDT
eukprot:1549205-Alexandrium_andersonii.AAC.1